MLMVGSGVCGLSWFSGLGLFLVRLAMVEVGAKAVPQTICCVLGKAGLFE